MFTAELIAFIILNVISFVFFAIAIYRFADHKKKYPIYSAGESVFGKMKSTIMIGFWLAILVFSSMYFYFILFLDN